MIAIRRAARHSLPRAWRAAWALSACVVPATAQAAGAPSPDDAASAPPQAVEIVGERASLASAQELKRKHVDIVDSVVADDIDKLPDLSVSDALQRITGVQIARDRDESSGVTVRGLTQIETTLNGREVFTAGAGRTLDFTDIPAELVSGIDVYKTASAARIEGGVGGQIDLRTRRPFDFPGLVLAGTVRYLRADLAHASDTSLSGLASQRWRIDGGGELGVLVAVSRQARPWREDQKSTGNPVARADLVPGIEVVVPGGTSETTSVGRRDRDAVNAVVQWRPRAGVELYLEGSAARLDTIQDSYQINAGASSTFVPGSVSLFPGTTDVRSVTWTNAPISILSFARDTADRTVLAAVGGQWRGDELTVSADLSRTASTDRLFFSGPVAGGTAARFTQDLSTFVPGTSVAGTNLLDPSGFDYTEVAYRTRPFSGSLTALRLDVERRLTGEWIRSVGAGLRVAGREAGNSTGLVFGDTAVTGLSMADLPGETVQKPYPDFLPGRDVSNLGPYLVGSLAQARDPIALRALFGITAPLPVAGNPLGGWRVDEATQSAYAMATLGDPSDALAGEVGVRAVRTRERVSGNESIPGSSGVQPVQVDDRRVDLLPSLNLRYALDAHHDVRLGASRTVTRPNFDQLSPSLTLVPNSVDPSLDSGSAGNPALRPIRADSLDLSVDYDGGRSTSASIAAFAKHVDGFVATLSQPETYDGVTYQVSRPRNSDAARIEGFEFAYQQFYTGLPGAWSGLGLQANATIVASATPDHVLGTNVPLANLSKRSFNLIGLYEAGPVSMRLAYNWRDRFLSGTTSIVGVGALPIYTHAYGWLDGSLVYRFGERVSVALTGNNLLDTTRRSYWSVTTRPQSVWIDDVQLGAALTVRL